MKELKLEEFSKYAPVLFVYIKGAEDLSTEESLYYVAETMDSTNLKSRTLGNWKSNLFDTSKRSSVRYVIGVTGRTAKVVSMYEICGSEIIEEGRVRFFSSSKSEKLINQYNLGKATVPEVGRKISYGLASCMLV